MGSSWSSGPSIRYKMIAVFLFCMLSWSCLAFEQKSNFDKLEVTQTNVIMQSNNPTAIATQRFDKLQRENNILAERLQTLENKLNGQKESKKILSENWPSYREEIMFLAERHGSGASYPVGKFEFSTVEIDPTSSFSKSDGMFTAPVDGIYIFQFYCYTAQSSRPDGYAEIKAYINGDNVERFWNVADRESDYAGHFSLFWSWNLKANDKIWLENVYESSTVVGPDHGMWFMGKRVVAS